MSGLGIAALLGAEHRGLLLGFTDEEDSFGFVESGQVRLHHIIFALTLLELHNRNLLLFRKSVHGGHESLGHRVHQGRGGKLVAAMLAEEFHHATFGLQHRHVDVQVHPIDAL